MLPTIVLIFIVCGTYYLIKEIVCHRAKVLVAREEAKVKVEKEKTEQLRLQNKMIRDFKPDDK